VNAAVVRPPRCLPDLISRRACPCDRVTADGIARCCGRVVSVVAKKPPSLRRVTQRGTLKRTGIANMSKLLLNPSRGLALAALCHFSWPSTGGGNADGVWLQEQTKPMDVGKAVSKLISALKDRSYWPDQYRAAEALGNLGPAAKVAVPGPGRRRERPPSPWYAWPWPRRWGEWAGPLPGRRWPP